MKWFAALFTFVIVITLVGFKSDTNALKSEFFEELPLEYMEIIHSDFKKNLKSTNLINYIEENFDDLFDEVVYIDGNYSPERGFYYSVYGNKAGKKVVDLLKISEEDFNNEKYTYISFSNELLPPPRYCRQGIFCPSYCSFPGNNCLGFICGTYRNGRCNDF